MKKMKYIVVIGMMFIAGVLLTACSSKNYDGTWNFPKNNDEMGMYLIIDGENATFKYEGIVYESGLLMVTTKEVSGTIFTGEVKNNQLTVTDVQEIDDNIDLSPSSFEGKVFKLSLSDDETALTLSEENGATVTFNK